MRQAFFNRLHQEMGRNTRIVVLTADLGYGLLDSIQNDFPERLLNVGVAEQTMIGMAAGLAAEGFQVFAYSIANFASYRCLEQIRNDICYHDLNVTIVSSGAGLGYGAQGYSHHGIEDLSALSGLPNLRVITPADGHEVHLSCEFALSSAKPTFIRLERGGTGRSLTNQSEISSPGVVKEGTQKLVLVHGSLLQTVFRGFAQYEEITIVSVPMVEPLNEDALIPLLKSHKEIHVIEEHVKLGGLGCRIKDVLVSRDIQPRHFRHHHLRQEVLERYGSRDYLLRQHGLDIATLKGLIRPTAQELTL